MQKDVDYTIDYFSGTINFINPAALDPTAEISVSYEENEFISFDQKLLVGSHLKYALDNKNYLAGLNIYKGKITFKGVSDAFNLEFFDPFKLLNQ